MNIVNWKRHFWIVFPLNLNKILHLRMCRNIMYVSNILIFVIVHRGRVAWTVVAVAMTASYQVTLECGWVGYQFLLVGLSVGGGAAKRGSGEAGKRGSGGAMERFSAGAVDVGRCCARYPQHANCNNNHVHGALDVRRIEKELCSRRGHHLGSRTSKGTNADPR